MQESKTQQSTVAYDYFLLLGGRPENFDPETVRRTVDFSKELETKRACSNFTTFPSLSDDMIIGNHLRLFSICEHHLLPFFGEVAICYIPDKLIFGLSKFQRIVDMISSRPQLQERLTHDILAFIDTKISPKGIAVQVKAIHTCVFARGVQSTNAEFTTTAVSGLLKENAQARNEFLININADGRLKI